MKTKLSVLLTLCIVSIAPDVTAQTHSCCAPSANQQFAMLGNDEAFKNSHASPLPFVFTPASGKFVTFKTLDGKDGRAFEVKGTGNNYILMFHEWWGLNDYIKQEAEKLQKDLGNVTVLAIDLYDGNIAGNPDDAKKYMQAVKEERAMAIIKGAIDYAGTNAKIGTIGWCFGGGWSLQAARLAGKQGAACVMYYGMPEKDVNKLKEIQAPVLGLFAKQDGWITVQLVNEFEKNMKDAGKSITIKFYDADHAFANPSNPKHDKAATEDAYKLTLDFFRQHLK